MPSSSSEARSRVALLALVTFPAWACATGVDNAPAGTSPLETSGAGGALSAGGSANAIAGSASAGKSGATGAAGSVANGGAPGSAGASGGKAGASSAGSGSGGASSAGATGKGGSSNAGASSGGASAGGKGGSSSAGASPGGASSGGASSGGSTGSGTCDAAHAVVTLTTQQEYIGKSDACVRLAVNPSWSVVTIQLQTAPNGTTYPVPFSFYNCGGDGTGSLTGDYMKATLKTGANPGCDFFVQFEGGSSPIKVTYYD